MGATFGLAIAFALLAFCSWIAAYSLLGPIVRGLFDALHLGTRDDYYTQTIATLAVTGIMVRSIDPRPWSDVGLARSNAGVRRITLGIVLGALPIAITCGVLLITGGMHFASSVARSSWIEAALSVTFILLPAALFEELLFRGYLLTVFRDRLGAKGAIVITSVLFSLTHLWNPGAAATPLIVVLLSGFALGLVRVVLNSLYAAWAAHFAWNWVMAVPFHVQVSGLSFETPGYKAVMSGPDWVSGGVWGPEGGIIAAVLLVAGLWVYLARHRREES